MNRKGMVLVAIIILIIFVGFGVAGVTTFIAQRLVQVDTTQRDLRCRYNAQAGLHYAIYQYRNSGTPFSGTIAINSNDSARVSTAGAGGGGGAASSLQINSTASSLGNKNKDILGITLTNTSASSSITLDQVILSLANGSSKIDEIAIGGSVVWTVNTTIGTTPVTLNINNVTIPANTTISLDYLRWQSAMPGAIVYVQFIMSDAATTSACTAYPPPASVCQTSSNLTIQSTGRTAGSGMYHTVEATYNPSTGNVSDYHEIIAAVP